MDSVDWGVDTDPARFPGTGQGLAPTDSDDPHGMPAVRAAGEQGYEPAPEAPMWIFLPAVWPMDARTWLPDTRVRHKKLVCHGEPTRVVPWSTADYFEMEADANSMLAACGLPSRPPGRFWLLKPPSAQPSLELVLDHLLISAERTGLQMLATGQFVEHVRKDLGVLFAT
jgi:Family of unknown function (DUF5956)